MEYYKSRCVYFYTTGILLFCIFAKCPYYLPCVLLLKCNYYISCCNFIYKVYSVSQRTIPAFVSADQRDFYLTITSASVLELSYYNLCTMLYVTLNIWYWPHHSICSKYSPLFMTHCRWIFRSFTQPVSLKVFTKFTIVLFFTETVSLNLFTKFSILFLHGPGRPLNLSLNSLLVLPHDFSR